MIRESWQQFCDRMEREVYDNLPRAEWLQLRLRDVTASSIGALFNIHPFVSPEQLVAEKRGLGGVMPTCCGHGCLVARVL